MYTNVPRGRNQYRGKAHKVRKKKIARSANVVKLAVISLAS